MNTVYDTHVIYPKPPKKNNQVENLQIEHAILENYTMQSVAHRSPFQEKKQPTLAKASGVTKLMKA